MSLNSAVELARYNMVEQQVRPWDVSDKQVLELMQTLPREQFVPEIHQRLAYADIEIPIGQNQKMMHPRLEGRVLQSLNIQQDDQVLEIGTGSGFLTAALASLCSHVDSVELYPELTEIASANLEALGVTNIALHTADVSQGWDDAPGQYDAIAVTASLPEYSNQYEALLKPGGRMFMVVGEAPVMEAILVTKSDSGEIGIETLFETELDPMEGIPEKASFSF